MIFSIIFILDIEIIDENNFVTCSSDKSIIFWNKKYNKFTDKRIIQNAHNREIMKVLHCSNGDLISGSTGGEINIWKKKNNLYNKINDEINNQLHQNNNLQDLLLLEDKNMFISGGEKGIILWNYNLNNIDLIKFLRFLVLMN